MQYDFGNYIDSKTFKKNMLHRKWVQEINLVEKVAREEGIRGCFSDDESERMDESRADLMMDSL